MLLFCLDNGLTRQELDWFMAGEPPGYQIMGNDYYGRNERIIKPDGSWCQAEDVLGWYTMTRQYYERYRKPVMHTETNSFNPKDAECWLWKQWVNVQRIRQDGVPVVGFTWYSLLDQLDWDISLREKRLSVNACGLYDLDRKIRPVGESYKLLLKGIRAKLRSCPTAKFSSSPVALPPSRWRSSPAEAVGGNSRPSAVSGRLPYKAAMPQPLTFLALHYWAGAGHEFDQVAAQLAPRLPPAGPRPGRLRYGPRRPPVGFPWMPTPMRWPLSSRSKNLTRYCAGRPQHGW